METDEPQEFEAQERQRELQDTEELQEQLEPVATEEATANEKPAGEDAGMEQDDANTEGQSEAATAWAAYGRSCQKLAGAYAKHEVRANGYSPEEVADLRVESEMAKQYGIPWQHRGPAGPHEGGPGTWRGQTFRAGSQKWATRGGAGAKREHFRQKFKPNGWGTKAGILPKSTPPTAPTSRPWTAAQQQHYEAARGQQARGSSGASSSGLRGAPSGPPPRPRPAPPKVPSRRPTSAPRPPSVPPPQHLVTASESPVIMRSQPKARAPARGGPYTFEDLPEML